MKIKPYRVYHMTEEDRQKVALWSSRIKRWVDSKAPDYLIQSTAERLFHASFGSSTSQMLRFIALKEWLEFKGRVFFFWQSRILRKTPAQIANKLLGGK